MRGEGFGGAPWGRGWRRLKGAGAAADSAGREASRLRSECRLENLAGRKAAVERPGRRTEDGLRGKRRRRAWRAGGAGGAREPRSVQGLGRVDSTPAKGRRGGKRKLESNREKPF